MCTRTWINELMVFEAIKVCVFGWREQLTRTAREPIDAKPTSNGASQNIRTGTDEGDDGLEGREKSNPIDLPSSLTVAGVCLLLWPTLPACHSGTPIFVNHRVTL